MNIIVDIDGTIAGPEQRLHYIQGENKDWDAFYEESVNDCAIYPNIDIVNTLSEEHTIIFLTGRSEQYRKITEYWIEVRHLPFIYENLFMRADDDYRPDFEVKKEIYETKILPKFGKVDLVLEDRDQVVKMWRELGITCWQVQEGSY